MSEAVLQALYRFEIEARANVHESAHRRSGAATAALAAARSRVARFLNAYAPDEVVFTYGTTSSLNLLAHHEAGLEALDGLDDDSARAKLDAVRGLGRPTAEYVLLRGCGRLNIFPGDDIGAQNNLRKWLGLKRSLNYDRVRTALRRWQPYAGLVCSERRSPWPTRLTESG
jgi:hypothetical protein